MRFLNKLPSLTTEKIIQNVIISGSYALITVLSQFLNHHTHLAYKGKKNVCD